MPSLSYEDLCERVNTSSLIPPELLARLKVRGVILSSVLPRLYLANNLFLECETSPNGFQTLLSRLQQASGCIARGTIQEPFGHYLPWLPHPVVRRFPASVATEKIRCTGCRLCI